MHRKKVEKVDNVVSFQVCMQSSHGVIRDQLRKIKTGDRDERGNIEKKTTATAATRMPVVIIGN